MVLSANRRILLHSKARSQHGQTKCFYRCYGAGAFRTYSWDRMPSFVRVTDVSPRDGLQNQPKLVSTSTKLELIQRLVSAGLSSIEVTSFVNPKLVPQMADAADIVSACRNNRIKSSAREAVAYPVLVPNLRGLQAACASGVGEITVLAAATNTFALKNTNATLEENVKRALDVVESAREAGLGVRAAIAVCFGCPFEGRVDPSSVAELVAKFVNAGCQEVGICDTIGVGTPQTVSSIIKEVQAAGSPIERVNVHFHDTYGLAMANTLTALQHGIAKADASVGGLGGCPFAGPGASGNAATEDLVHMLHRLGIDTGVNLDLLAETGSWICQDVLGLTNGSKAGKALRASAMVKTPSAPEDTSSGSPSSKTADDDPKNKLPLAGLRVLEVGPGLIAGGWTGATLGYFGADVIKVEPPQGGDGIRKWRHLDGPGGDSLWWQSIARNKRSIAIDLRTTEGRVTLRHLIVKVDILIENFKPGTLEKWGMSTKELRKTNPSLVVARLSGYGQTGPNSALPGFASVCEGVGGFRHLNGFPGMPPVRPNLSIGDTLAATNAVLGILLAVLHRYKASSGLRAAGHGQDVDVSIVESVFGLLESCVPEYDRLGDIRGPSGSTLTGIVPSGTYLCKDGGFVIIGANGDSLFRRLMMAMERHDLAEDPSFADNAGRVAKQNLLDDAITQWTSQRSVREVASICDEISVPCGRIYSVKDIVEDEHFQARGCFETVSTKDGQPLKIPAIRPLLSASPGKTHRGGPGLGEHTEAVLEEILGMNKEEIGKLKESGIVA